jgi:uncharacterized protein (UPF0548 family)
MFFFRRPNDDAVRSILASLRHAELTYADPGITREPLAKAPSGFVLDQYGTILGEGAAVYDRARAALSRLENYPPSFTRIVFADDALRPGQHFATVASHLGFYSVHPCRVLFVIDEPDRFGLGFGTLPGHEESGEERFLISRVGDVVRYDVQAFSRPNSVLSRLGAPVTRSYQRRFQRETLETLRLRARG